MTSLGIVLHIFNESMMLPHFIEHHKDLVDEAIVIDHNSTDLSREVIETLAPGWKIVPSKLNCFDAIQTDLEVQEWEKTLRTDWKLALTITEFIWNLDFKEKLAGWKERFPQNKAFGAKSYCLVDREPTESLKMPLWADHHYGAFGNLATNVSSRWRYAHCAESGQYHPGRHSTNLPSANTNDLFLLHFRYAPYPQCLERKLQIGARVPQSDIVRGMGTHHQKTPEAMEKDYQLWLAESSELLNDPIYKSIYDARMSNL